MPAKHGFVGDAGSLTVTQAEQVDPITVPDLMRQHPFLVRVSWTLSIDAKADNAVHDAVACPFDQGTPENPRQL